MPKVRVDASAFLLRCLNSEKAADGGGGVKSASGDLANLLAKVGL